MNDATTPPTPAANPGPAAANPGAPADPQPLAAPKPSDGGSPSQSAATAGQPSLAPAPATPPPPAAAEPVPQPAVVAAVSPQNSQPSTLNHQPLAQSKGESSRAFEAFRAYLELGPKRRYAAVGKIVGASLRTIKGWASDFDWRGRVKTYTAQASEHYMETERSARCENLLDAAARAKAFRDRQYLVAEAFLDATERYLENVDEGDLDQMSFAEACKASEVASRLGEKAAGNETKDPSAPARSLTDQVAALLDQIYPDDPSETDAAGQPNSATPTQPQP